MLNIVFGQIKLTFTPQGNTQDNTLMNLLNEYQNQS